MMLSLDISKPSDSVNMELILAKFGFGEEFVHCFRALYTHPCTRIRLPGCNSEYFALGRGTRQAFPLSPLLFVFAIKPLAHSIRMNPDIWGYAKGDQQVKLSLYVDNVLLFLTDLMTARLRDNFQFGWSGPGDHCPI